MKNIIQQINDDLILIGDNKRLKFNQNKGWKGPQYGITLGKLRAYAKQYKDSHQLGLKLSKSDNLDILILSCLLMDGKQMNKEELSDYLPDYPQLIDEYVNSVVRTSPYLKELSLVWINKLAPNYQQAGWQGLVHCVESNFMDPQENDSLLDLIEKRLATVTGSVQFNMNHCLASIGIESESHRSRAKEIAMKLGIYRDMKVSKGCTSPYAIEWIDVILEKRGLTDSKK